MKYRHTLLIVLLVGAASTLAAEPVPATHPASAEVEMQKFTFPLRKGDYVFIGIDPGSKNRTPDYEGVLPLYRWGISPDAAGDEWHLNLSVTERRTGQELQWEFDAQIITRWPNGDPKQVYRLQWKDPMELIRKAKNAEPALLRSCPIKSQAMAHPELPQLALTRIAYADDDGEARCVVVAIADGPESVRKVIQIPKAFLIYSWDSVHTLK